MDPQQQGQNENKQGEPMQQQYEDDDDDLDDLGLFHKSSLKNKEECPLPEVVPQSYNTKRITTPQNETKIKQYTQLCRLGSGSFAQVKKVSHNNTLYAMKIYSLSKLKSRKFYAADGSFADSEEMFRNQVEIIKRVSHGNLARCVEILYGGNYAYVVMELCDLGQIMDWSEEKNNFVRNPKVVEYLSTKYNLKSIQDVTRVIFLQAALGLQYLHSHNISNRDIKVDNLLCKTSPAEVQGQDIKIADFTTARYSNDDISFFTCGTAGFRCPEMINAGAEGYSCKSLDIWSLGISMYTYYHELFPFMEETEYMIEVRAEKEGLKYAENCPSWLRNVLQKMTIKSWKQRIAIDEVVNLLTATSNS